MKYVVLSCMRNEEKNVEKFLDMIYDLKPTPKRVVVVNDGSTDKTGKILENYNKAKSVLTIVNRIDRGFSALGTKLMADVYNDGWKQLSYDDWDYLLVVSPDTFLPEDYVRKITTLMEEQDLAIAGGLPNNMVLNPEAVTGSGRIIRREIMDYLDGYPQNYAWEDTMFSASWMKGYKTKHFPEVHYFQNRKGGEGLKRSYVGWGRGMKDTGYIFTYMFLRSMKMLLKRKFRMAGGFIYGYCMQPYTPTKVSDWRRNYMKKRLRQRIKTRIKKVF